MINSFRIVKFYFNEKPFSNELNIYSREHYPKRDNVSFIVFANEFLIIIFRA